MQRLRDAVAIANIPSLIPVLVQLTGDERWLDGSVPADAGPRAQRPRRRWAAAGDAGTRSARPRSVAIEAWLGGVPAAIPEPSEALLLRMLSVSMAESIPAEYGPMLRHVLGLVPEREVDRADRSKRPRRRPGYQAVVIGAGASGIAMAVELDQGRASTTRSSRRPTPSVARGGTTATRAAASTRRATSTASRSTTTTTGRPTSRCATRCTSTSRRSPPSSASALTCGCGRRSWPPATTRPARPGTSTCARADGATETLRADAADQRGRRLRPPDRSRPSPASTTSRASAATRRAGPTGFDLTGKRVARHRQRRQRACSSCRRSSTTPSTSYVFTRSPQWAAPFEKFHLAGARDDALALPDGADVPPVVPACGCSGTSTTRTTRRCSATRTGSTPSAR